MIKVAERGDDGIVARLLKAGASVDIRHHFSECIRRFQFVRTW